MTDAQAEALAQRILAADRWRYRIAVALYGGGLFILGCYLGGFLWRHL